MYSFMRLLALYIVYLILNKFDKDWKGKGLGNALLVLFILLNVQFYCLSYIYYSLYFIVCQYVSIYS